MEYKIKEYQEILDKLNVIKEKVDNINKNGKELEDLNNECKKIKKKMTQIKTRFEIEFTYTNDIYNNLTNYIYKKSWSLYELEKIRETKKQTVI